MGVPLSKGTLENIPRRSWLKEESAYQKLRRVIEVSLFMGPDETEREGERQGVLALGVAYIAGRLYVGCLQSFQEGHKGHLSRWPVQGGGLFGSPCRPVEHCIERVADLLGSPVVGSELPDREGEWSWIKEFK